MIRSSSTRDLYPDIFQRVGDLSEELTPVMQAFVLGNVGRWPTR